MSSSLLMAHESAPSPAADLNGNNEVYRYINLKLAALGQPTSTATADPEFLEIAGPLLRNYYQKDQLARRPALPRGRAHPGLPRFLSSRRLRRRPRLPSHTFVAGPPRHGPRDVAAARRRFDFLALSEFLPRAAGRAAQSAAATAAPPGHFPHRRRRLARFPPTRSPCPKQAFARAAGRRARIRRTICCALPFTADQDEQARCFVSLLLRPLVCPAAGGDPRRRRWRSASSRPAAWSAISISWKAFSATPAIPTCRKTMPRSTSSTGPATPAA